MLSLPVEECPSLEFDSDNLPDVSEAIGFLPSEPFIQLGTELARRLDRLETHRLSEACTSCARGQIAASSTPHSQWDIPTEGIKPSLPETVSRLVPSSRPVSAVTTVSLLFVSALLVLAWRIQYGKQRKRDEAVTTLRRFAVIAAVQLRVTRLQATQTTQLGKTQTKHCCMHKQYAS